MTQRPEAHPRLPKITHATAGPRSAEQYVTAVLQWLLRAKDATVTPGSGDHGLDVISRDYSVQVKHFATQAVGRPDIQRLVGARRPLTVGLFFTSSRYTDAAREYAGQHGIALFTYDPAGLRRPHAVNKTAKRLLKGTREPHIVRRYETLKAPLSHLAKDQEVPKDIRKKVREVVQYLEQAGQPREDTRT